MDWANFWTQLAGGLLGALVGGSAIAYFNGYYSKKGERTLLREELPRILEEEFDKAYRQEKGKRLATHEDIEDVRKDVRVVTLETETIKAQIGNDLWTRQMVWQQKREAYLNILKRNHELQGRIGTLRATHIVFDNEERKDVPAEHLLRRKEQLVAGWSEYAEAQRQFLDYLVEAKVFLNEEASALMNECLLDERLKIDFTVDPNKVTKREDSAFQVMAFLAGWAKKMVKVARRELGVEI